MKNAAYAAIAASSIAVLLASGFAGARATALPTPIPQASQTAPPDVIASPTTPPLLVNGQMIDLERGFVVFSSGDAFRLAPSLKIVDSATGATPTYSLEPGLYAVAGLDPATGLVTSLRTSRRPLAEGTPAAQVPRQYVAQASSPYPNPDLAPPKKTYTSQLSKSVAVEITALVPPDTPFTDDIYMTTDSSGWNPRAVKMQRMDGRHFRIEIALQGGTELHYLFTRGAWTSVERDRSGLERSARLLSVPGGDAMTVDVTVQRWADLP
jgi:hypothetical protein